MTITGSTPTSTFVSEPLVYNRAADITNGVICFLCFLIGTTGNTASFLYFFSKKRDIPRLLYLLITATDTVISVTVLPVGVSYLFSRAPGMFGSEFLCNAWIYSWYGATKFSIFLVICLCVSRTYSLMRPFKRQSIRVMTLAVAGSLTLQLARLIAFHLLEGTKIVYSSYFVRCEMYLAHRSTVGYFIMMGSEMLTFVAPMIAVTTSCIVSAVLLNKKDSELGAELQRSRNRATVTILLFAVLYGLCNVPLVLRKIMRNYALHISKDIDDFYDFYDFDNQGYFGNASMTLLIAANSAANPILYFWRMDSLREFVLSGMRRMCHRWTERRVVTPSHHDVPQRVVFATGN